jgi:hypothetical protein
MADKLSDFSILTLIKFFQKFQALILGDRWRYVVSTRCIKMYDVSVLNTYCKSFVL